MLKPEKIGDYGTLYDTDCLEALKQLEDNFVTSICADPPSGTSFMNKNWDKDKGGRDQWINWLTEIMKECLRVIKPGGMIAIWAFPRTSHWTATAIEDAGFIIKEKFYHIFGSGFPKSSNISKNLDQKLGKARKVIGSYKAQGTARTMTGGNYGGGGHNIVERDRIHQTEATSDEAKLFDGYGTATKPAVEEWIIAMAPLDGTYAENALKHGLAGINVDLCRIGTEKITQHQNSGGGKYARKYDGHNENLPVDGITTTTQGRWPANLLLQHHPECIQIGTKKVKGSGTSKTFHSGYEGESNTKFIRGISHPSNQHADQNGNETIEDWECHEGCPIRIIGEQSGVRKSGDNCVRTKDHSFFEHGGMGKAGDVQTSYGDKGTAARFFLNLPPENTGFLYQSKPSKKERNLGCEELDDKQTWASQEKRESNSFDVFESDGRQKTINKNNHPTVKSLELIKYLVKLVAPPQDPIILDLFAGSGTTGVACEQLKIPYILMEKEVEYCDIIRARVKAANKPITKTKTVRTKVDKSGLFDMNEIDINIVEG